MEVEKSAKMEQILDRLKTAGDLKEFLVESNILTDDLSLRLIEKIGGPNSPMAATELSANGFPTDDSALIRLFKLQKMGIFNSRMVKKGSDYVRLFEPTPVAKRIAKTISQAKK